MIFKSFFAFRRSRRGAAAEPHPMAQRSEPGPGRLLWSSREHRLRVLRWTQSEEKQEWERANQSPQGLFPASGRGRMREVYFGSCGCGHGVAAGTGSAPAPVGAALGLWQAQSLWERSARAENVKFYYSQPILCMENKLFFSLNPPCPLLQPAKQFELHQTAGLRLVDLS